MIRRKSRSNALLATMRKAARLVSDRATGYIRKFDNIAV